MSGTGVIPAPASRGGRQGGYSFRGQSPWLMGGAICLMLAGALFVAVEGPHSDGHFFLADAVERAARHQAKLEKLLIASGGMAGPGGGNAQKPVGLVCLGVAGKDGAARVEGGILPGDRTEIRNAALLLALILTAGMLPASSRRGQSNAAAGVSSGLGTRLSISVITMRRVSWSRSSRRPSSNSQLCRSTRLIATVPSL